MRLAINGQQLARQHKLPEALDVIARFGVDAIELWPANVGPREGTTLSTSEESERWEGRDLDGAAKLLQERGVTVACVTLGFFAAPVCFAAGGTQRFTEALCGAVDAAVALGSKLVNCYSTGIPAQLFISAARPAAAYAEGRGVTITLENEAHDESATPESVRDIVKAVGSPGLGTQFDPCNYYHAYIEPYPRAYEIIAPHICYVHLKGGCHFRPEASGVHRGSTMRESQERIGYLPLPDAAFPIDAIVRRLKQGGYAGFVTLEPHVPSEALEEFYAIEVPYVKGLISRD